MMQARSAMIITLYYITCINNLFLCEVYYLRPVDESLPRTLFVKKVRTKVRTSCLFFSSAGHHDGSGSAAY